MLVLSRTSMSQRELKALGVTTERETDPKSSRSGLVRGVEMDHDNSGERIAELEAELVSAKRAIEEKDQKVQELCRELEETKEAYRVVEQESRERQEKLAMESERSSLNAEVEKFRALEKLRQEHKEMILQEKKQVEEWVRDVKERHELEKQRLEERIAVLEAEGRGTRAHSEEGGAAESDTHASGSADSARGSTGDIPTTGPGEESDLHTTGGIAEDSSPVGDGAPTTSVSTDAPDPVLPDGSDSPTLMQTVTKLLQAQTQAMAAQALATAVQHLPPLPTYTGEKEQARDEGFERWLERFEERAALASWSSDQKLHQLKLLLDKTAREVFRTLPEEERSSYDKATKSLKKWFQTGDIEELRGLEFHHKTQGNESVEQLGIELQRLGRKAFPSSQGREFDRLLKGRFFQALHVKWQRKLGAPRPGESFRELYDRARTHEQHEKQYVVSAATRNEGQKSDKKDQPSNRVPWKSQDSRNKDRPETETELPPPSQPVRSSSRTERRYNNRSRHGTGPRSNRESRSNSSQEAPGRSDVSRNAVVGQVLKLEDFTDEQLQTVLQERRLHREQELFDEASSTSAVSAAGETQGAVGPTMYLDIQIEGVPVRAMFDTGAQSTIISRSVLHLIGKQLRQQGRPLPTLQKPCTTLFGKDGAKGPEIVVTAQFDGTVEADGKTVHATLFVQPDSEQPCLLGTNIIPHLGVTISRANGDALLTSPEPDTKIARVCLVQSTTIPSQKGRFIEGRVLSDPCKVDHLLFEPKRELLGPLGIDSYESVISLRSDGTVLIPLENYQGIPVKLEEGVELGTVRECDLTKHETSGVPGSCGTAEPEIASRCAAVKALPNTPERFEQLLKMLELPANKLSPEELAQLKQLLSESTDIFALDDSELGCTNLVQHSIDTGEHRPIKQQPYRVPVIYREKIEKMITDMQAQGVVKPSKSPWASPIVLVPKKDGNLRFCVDFRKLNAITKKDVYPLPRVDDILDTLGDAQYFTSLDLASGYWQVELDEDARAKSAFTTHYGLFEFIRMPFGLCNAPATFQRAMQAVLAGLEWRSCFVYLDDILIASRTLDEHLCHIREVFSRLREAGLRLKPKKCLLLRNEVPYLGHVISAQGIHPDPAKTDKVKRFPTPSDVTTLRQFVGLASYYRRFVPGFAKIAAPLHALTKKDVPFHWTTECETAFRRLKELLVSAPVLAYPKFGGDIEFVLETDASRIGLGAVLSQRQQDGLLHPIAYASRSLNLHEKNYCISELETLGLVWAVRYFRPYLLGHRTVVYTDHSACLSLLNTPHPSGKLARWALTVQEMDLSLKHRSGKQNTNADALSRNPVIGSHLVSGSDGDFENSCKVSIDSKHVSKRPCVGSKRSCEQPRCDVNCSDVCADADSCDENICSVCAVKSDVNADVSAGIKSSVGTCEIRLQEDGATKDGARGLDEPAADVKLKESSEKIRELQLQDCDLAQYVTYLECSGLPEEDRVAKKVVLESGKMEVIDGILYREDSLYPGHWCVVVPKELRVDLLTEAHSCVFSGHFAERKVYSRLRKSYWWPGMRADVRRFCRGCLNCASRKGPSRGVCPPLQPIPVKGPFHRVGVDVLELPLTSTGNRYIVVFLDYLTKWVEAYAVPDQRAETIARLLVENIVCRHGVPEEMLSDRGANFLSNLILNMCSLLGIKKVNTSGYHPQTDGLVEKFNSTITNMIAKACDGTIVEWDKQLPLLLLAYRSSVQDSTRESPFFLLYGRDPRLPTASDFDLPRVTYAVDLDDYKTEFAICLKKAQECAREQIQVAQEKQKKFYDRKSAGVPYRTGERVMVYMPHDTTGRDRKLARPYHGPYRIVSVTPTNAEVKLIDRVEEPSIFVAVNRLRRWTCIHVIEVRHHRIAMAASATLRMQLESLL